MKYFRRALLIALLSIAFSVPTFAASPSATGLSSGSRFIEVMAEQTLQPRDQFDSLIVEFGSGFDASKYDGAFNLASKLGRAVRFVSMRYRTVDPLGNEVVASGLMAYPETGNYLGVIEISPICKERYLAGSRRLFTIECLPSMRGYVVLVPDTIGYGDTEDVPIALLMSQNVARVSADMRIAAEEYFLSLGGKKLPHKSILFGYSLGAAGALETACLYAAHPEMNVRLVGLYLASGAYYPDVAIGTSIAKGENGYLVYPAIALSLNRWMGLGMDYDNLFIGDVRRDFDKITVGNDNLGVLAREVYGTDVHKYLHPEFFASQRNSDIDKLMGGLASLKVPSDGWRLPRDLKIYLRHSVEDTFVPVECTDRLHKELRNAGYLNTYYYRDKHGTHYEEAASAFVDLFLMILL